MSVVFLFDESGQKAKSKAAFVLFWSLEVKKIWRGDRQHESAAAMCSSSY